MSLDATRSNPPVVIAPEVLHGFSFLYQYVNETDFVLCLEGSNVDDGISRLRQLLAKSMR